MLPSATSIAASTPDGNDPSAPPRLVGGQGQHGRRDSASQVEEAALAAAGGAAGGGAAGGNGVGIGGSDDGDHDDQDDALTAAATHHPVVLVRLPVRRPRARPWTREEEARLTSICQERWPRVDWRAVAAELGRGVQDCVSRSTLLHLQELERSSRRGQQPASPSSPQSPPPAPSVSAHGARRAPAVAGHGRQDEREREEGAPPAAGPAPAPRPSSPLGLSGSGSGSRGSAPSKMPPAGLLASEVAALARRHQFDWAAVGAVLQADPWECWKLYEETNQHQQQQQQQGLPPHRAPFVSGLGGSGSSSGGGGDHSLFHSATAALSTDDDHHYPFAPGQQLQQPLGLGRSTSADDVAAFLPPTTRGSPPASPLLATRATSGGSDGSSTGRAGLASSSLLPPLDLRRAPVPVAAVPAATGSTAAASSSFLHQFPRPHHHHQRNSPSLPGPFARPPSAGDLGGLQDSLALGSVGVGGGQSTLFLPGQDSLSLSVLESALLDMPSLYLGRSSLAPGGGGGGGGGASTLGFGAGSHLGGALTSSAILGGLGPVAGAAALSPIEAGAHRAGPPFFHHHHQHLPIPPRGVGYTTADIPDTIDEGGPGEGEGAT